jgi:hypothetical protein
MRHSGDRNALKLSAREFNRTAEEHYRVNLREAYQDLCEDALTAHNCDAPEMREMMRYEVRVQDTLRLLESGWCPTT